MTGPANFMALLNATKFHTAQNTIHVGCVTLLFRVVSLSRLGLSLYSLLMLRAKTQYPARSSKAVISEQE